jgi:hypothetical protein
MAIVMATAMAMVMVMATTTVQGSMLQPTAGTVNKPTKKIPISH